MDMTSKAVRKKVIEYINHAKDDVIEVVYKIFKIYEDGEGKSMMTTDQKSEIESRTAFYKQGTIKTSSWSELKKQHVEQLPLPKISDKNKKEFN